MTRNNLLHSKTESQSVRIVIVGSGTGRWGFSIENEKRRCYLAGAVPGKTSNELELIAALHALQSLPSGSRAILATRLDYLRLGVDSLLTAGVNSYRHWYKQFKSGDALNQELWACLEVELRRLKVVAVSATKDEQADCRKHMESWVQPLPPAANSTLTQAAVPSNRSPQPGAPKIGTVQSMFPTQTCEQEIIETPQQWDEVPW